MSSPIPERRLYLGCLVSRPLHGVSLLDLADEILLAICTHLCPHCTNISGFNDLAQLYNTCIHIHPATKDEAKVAHVKGCRTALASLCQTSKRLRSIATPLLYHLFHVGTSRSHFNDDDGRIETGLVARSGMPNDKQPRPASHVGFLRTICQCPDLMTHVRMAIFRIYFDLDTRHSHLASDLASLTDDKLPVRWVPPSAGPEYAPGRLYDDYAPRRLRHEFLTDTVLRLATRLEHLSLEMLEDVRYGGYLPENTILPALRTLHASNKSLRHYPFSLHHIRPVLEAAPGLRYLELHKCRTASADLPLAGLRVLRLGKPEFPEGDYADLFAACGRLEALSFHYWLDPTPGFELHNYAVDLRPVELVDALTVCSQTLRYLEIQWDESDDEVGSGVITDLTSFTSLETLILDALCVYPHWDLDTHVEAAEPGVEGLADLLPASLEALLIRRFRMSAVPDLMRLANQAYDGVFPELAEVWILAADGVVLETGLPSIREVFVRAGISFRVISDLETEFFSEADALLAGDYRIRVPVSAR